MRSPRSAFLSVLAAGLLLTAAGLVAPAPASATTHREARLVAKINDVRASHGLRPVRISADLAAAAHAHSAAMAAQGALFHTPSFSAFCCWRSIAENVGTGFSVRGLHHEFMRSAPHRANILAPAMRQVGVGIVSVDGRLWVTEVFRQPAG